MGADGPATWTILADVWEHAADGCVVFSGRVSIPRSSTLQGRCNRTLPSADFLVETYLSVGCRREAGGSWSELVENVRC